MPLKMIARSVFIFIIVFGGLSFSWAALGVHSTTTFEKVGNHILSSFNMRDQAFFQVVKEDKQGFRDTRFYLKKVEANGAPIHWYTSVSSRLGGFNPLAMFLALVLATPLALRRRVRALFLGIPVVLLFIYFRLVSITIYTFQTTPDGAVPLWELAPMLDQLIVLVNNVAWFIGTGFVVPVIIWVAVSFRADDWDKFLVERGSG